MCPSARINVSLSSYQRKRVSYLESIDRHWNVLFSFALPNWQARSLQSYPTHPHPFRTPEPSEVFESRPASYVCLTIIKFSMRILPSHSFFCQKKNEWNNTDRGNPSSPDEIFTSKHLMTWLAYNPELRAMTSAISSAFIVKSRCNSDMNSGRNSANAMARGV
jgi:hypothetical protein